MTEFKNHFEAHRNDPVYVILGVQGSGTNLISKLIRQVASFSVVHDRCLVFDKSAALINNCGPANVQKQFAHLHRSLFPGPIRKRLVTKHYHHQNKNFVGIEKHFSAADIHSPADFANFVYGYRAFYAGADNKAIKSDDLWERMGQIDDVLPNRRYIQLVRDCRDNALSIMNKNFGPRDIYTASEYVRHRLNIYRKEIDRKIAPTIIVKYETLLTNPMGFVKQFLDAFDVTPVSNWEDNINAFPIRPGNFDKWRRLPAKQLAVSEAVLKDELLAFDYKLSDQPLAPVSPMQRTLHRLKDCFQRVPQRVGVTISNIVSP